jgi:hypothetical protein
LNVTASEEFPTKFTTGPALAPPPTAPLMVASPVFVAGLAVPLPFQFPDGAIRNHIARCVKSTATPIVGLLESEPSAKPVDPVLAKIPPNGVPPPFPTYTLTHR